MRLRPQGPMEPKFTEAGKGTAGASLRMKESPAYRPGRKSIGREVMSSSCRPRFFHNQILILSVLYEVVGIEIGKLVDFFHPLPRRNILKIVWTLKKQGMVETYRARGSKKWVVHLTARGFDLAGYAFPLKNLDFDRNVYLLLRPETASKETGVSVRTIRRKKSLFTYVTVGHRLYVIKRGKISLIKEKIPRYPFVEEDDLPLLMENPPLRSPVVREAIRNAGGTGLHRLGFDGDLLFYPLFFTGILKNPGVEIRQPGRFRVEIDLDVEFLNRTTGGEVWEDYRNRSSTEMSTS